jgi:hypothetical protein
MSVGVMKLRGKTEGSTRLTYTVYSNWYVKWQSQTELLNLQKRGQFPDESVKIKDTQIHNVNVPDVLGIGTLKVLD